MSAVRAVPHCGGADEGDCPEAPVIALTLYARLATVRTRWAACPAHLYSLLAEVDGQAVEVEWLGRKP